jgi:hypothetical protein
MVLGTANTLAVGEHREKSPADARWLEGKTGWWCGIPRGKTRSCPRNFISLYRGSRDLFTYSNSNWPTFMILRVRIVTRHAAFSQFPHVPWYLEPQDSTFNIQYSTSMLPIKSATLPNQCLHEAKTGLNVNEGCFAHKEGRARYIDDVRHTLNVVSLPCRMRVDNPRRLASQCEFLILFIRECVLQVTVYQTTYYFLAIHQQTANYMTRCQLWFANSICVWPAARCSFRKGRYMRGRPRNAFGELVRSVKR